MFVNTASIIKKNILTLLHSKLSAIILFLGPFALILLLWITLGGSALRDVPLGYIPADDSAISSGQMVDFDQLVSSALAKHSFSISLYGDKYSCFEDVKSGRISGCLVASKEELIVPAVSGNLPNTYQKSMGYKTEAYLDFSKQRVVWGVIANLNNALADASKQLQSTAFSDFSQAGDSSLKAIEISIEELGNLENALSLIESNLTSIQNKMVYNQAVLESALLSLNYSIADLERYFNQTGLPLPYAFYAVNNSYTYASSLAGNGSGYALLNRELSQIIISVRSTRNEIASLRSNLTDTLNQIRGLQNTDVYKLVNPIDSSYFSISGQQVLNGKISDNLNFLDYIFPSFFAFFSLFVSLIFSTLLVTKERISKSASRNALSNTSSFSYVLGNFLSILIILLFQTAIILATAYLTIDSLSYNNLVALFFASIFSISIFGSIGLCLGYLFNSEETAILASISFSLIFLLLSPLINPVETMPFLLRLLVQLSPIYLTESMFNRIVIFDAPFDSFYWEIFALSFFSIALLLIGVLLHRITRYRDV